MFVLFYNQGVPYHPPDILMLTVNGDLTSLWFRSDDIAVR